MKPNLNNKPTRVPGTEAQYEKKFKSLVNGARIKYSIPSDEDVGLEKVVVHFLEKAASEDWSYATTRFNRAALNYKLGKITTEESNRALEIMMSEGKDEDGEIDTEKRQELNRRRQERKKVSPNTSQQKAKTLSDDDRMLINAELFASRSKYSYFTEQWLRASQLTGLRPTEWRNAILIEDELDNKKCLVVQNAKNTNGRSHGKQRTIVIHDMSEDDIKSIELQCMNAKMHSESEELWDLFYNGCRETLHAASRRALSKRKVYPSLYTGRHAFAADAKKQFSKEEVAILMGHEGLDTASINYARATSKTKGTKVKPHADDVERIKFKNDGKVSKREIKMEEFIRRNEGKVSDKVKTKLMK